MFNQPTKTCRSIHTKHLRKGRGIWAARSSKKGPGMLVRLSGEEVDDQEGSHGGQGQKEELVSGRERKRVVAVFGTKLQRVGAQGRRFGKGILARQQVFQLSPFSA